MSALHLLHNLVPLLMFVVVIHAFAEQEDAAISHYFAKASEWKRLASTGRLVNLLVFVLPVAAMQLWLLYGFYETSNPALIMASAGMCLGDAIFSHVTPWLRGVGKSPGHTTALLYLLIAAVIVALVHGSNLHTIGVDWYLLYGAMGFIPILPMLWLIGVLDD